MRTPYLFLSTVALALLLESCTSTGQSSTQLATNFINRQTIVTTSKEKYPPKDPQAIALFTKEKAPHAPYRIIGVATVSKYNLLGMQRKNSTLDDMMKKLAASIGGDGLINLSNNDENIKANVIAFQKILI